MRLLSRCAPVIALGLLTLVAGFAIPRTAHALTVTCVNADATTRPPYNVVDRCSVSPVDKATHFVAELTGGESACDPVRHTSNRQRIRVVADYVSGGKLLIRSIDIRYLSGTMPWAYYRVHVIDGNGHNFIDRHWNNGGDLITWDGASDVVDNTVHIVPNRGFAPTFGARGWIQIRVYPHFFAYPSANSPQKCTGDDMLMHFLGP